MKKRLKLTTISMFIAAAFLGIGAFFAGIESISASVPAIDRAKEAEYKRASESSGCNSMPYSDLRTKCADISRDVKLYCKTTPLRCVEYRAELAEAKRAVEEKRDVDKNKKRIEAIRQDCLQRRSTAQNCATARANGMGIFERAKSKLTIEKKTYEDALDYSKRELASKSSRKKPDAIKAYIEHYEKMLEYIGTILQHFADEYEEHERTLNRYKEVVSDCDRFNHNFD